MGKSTNKEYTRKKISVPIIKIGDDGLLRGVLLGTRTTDIMDKETGELKEVSVLMFSPEPESDERFQMLADRGLVNALKWADVKDGDFIEVQKLEKKDLGGGKTVNQYDVFQLS